jgi:hypothetical protein
LGGGVGGLWWVRGRRLGCLSGGGVGLVFFFFFFVVRGGGGGASAVLSH